MSYFSAQKCGLEWSLQWIFSISLSENLSCCPLRFLRFPSLTWTVTPLCVETFPPSWLHPWGAGPYPELLCLPFCIYLFLHPIPRRLVCLFGSLGYSTRMQKIFCGSFSICRWFFYIFVREKVVSLPNSSIILKPPPFYSKFWNQEIWNFKLYFVYTLFCLFRLLEFHVNFRMEILKTSL